MNVQPRHSGSAVTPDEVEYGKHAFPAGIAGPAAGCRRRRRLRSSGSGPVRVIRSLRGQRNNPGLYYSATLGAHVEFESWLERDEALALDFDPDVVGFAAQPFRLSWTEGARQQWHVPDFFARRVDGEGVVIDCRPAARIRARDEESFAASERACAGMGWAYRLVTGHDAVWLGAATERVGAGAVRR
ncbi:TnsA-like heteromeric transposase endonuclease subunit [Nocardia sp. NPDC052278]|uniref:TnsA-like heteromeric transposase endonuclease subunit n=1 Tax=unclassified Nocardia TaxID=2637762 RepID=UPI003677B176